MKKLLGFIFACFVAVLGFAIFRPVAHSANAISQEINNAALSAVTITQEGYVFSADDFEVVTNGSSTTYNLYVNTAITINAPEVGMAGVNWQRSGHATVQITLPTDADYVQLEYDSENLNKSLVTINYRQSATSEISLFSFNLIQTPDHFETDPTFVWKDDDNQVTTPTSTGYYANSLTLQNLYSATNPIFENASEDNTVFVEFYFNGEFYSIYTNNDQSIFYNTLTGNQIANSSISFTEAGEYQVYIYDKTAYKMLKEITIGTNTYKILDRSLANGSPFANVINYSFKLSKTNISQNMIILAKDDDGNTVVTTQKINGNVNINFQNLDAAYINRILVVRSYDTKNNEHLQDRVNLRDNYSINELNTQTLVYDQDGNYTITIYDKSNHAIKTFTFEILKSIYTEKDGLSNTDRTLVPQSNVIYSIDRNKIIDTSYNGLSEISNGSNIALKSSTTTEYIVRLARPDTKVLGVSNGEKTSEVPVITVYGVGTLDVTVVKDNVTTKYTLHNGSTLSGISDIADYSIYIQDQMGTTASISFSITRALNPATIALIVVAVALLVIVLFIIIRIRTRIKVK